MWKDIIGHQEQVRQLEGCIESGKVPHALLFAGPRGLGKTHVALEFFKALNCLKSPGAPCQTCKSCLMAEAGTHPDFRLLGPDRETRQIQVNPVREIIAETGLKPYRAGMRVIVIEPAERMNKASSNALLKTLEEPPEGTLIILVSHNPSLLLPTILSRCQVVRFSPVEAGQGGSLDPVLLRLTSGTLGGLPEGESEEVLQIRSQILGVLKGGDPVELAGRYFSDRTDRELAESRLAVFLLLIESMLRDILVLAHGGDRVINEELGELEFHRVRLPDAEDLSETLYAVRRGARENVLPFYAVSELLMKMKRMM